MTVFLGTLWNSIKEIKPLYIVDWEPGNVLHAMQGNWASSRGEGEVSWVFSSCAGTWGIFSSYDGDAHSKREFVSEVRTLV